ncbi:MAG: TonB-dependent receptor [Sphingobium sp.]
MREQNLHYRLRASLIAMTICGLANTAHAQEQQSADTSVSEIVVTAQKREERLATVPLPVAVVQASNLASRSQFRIQDYYLTVPGLSYTANQLGGAATISIRGLASSDFSAPTVGITVDDMPFGSSTLLGGGFLVPDLDPSDLARIEVLRGPQGTLYGASSIGGLLKYVTQDPSTKEMSGRLSAGIIGVSDSSDVGYNFGGSVNVPLNEQFAIRASGFARFEPGYIDNLGYASNSPIERDVNGTKVKGGHLSALWRPEETLSVKLNGFMQSNRIHGSPYVRFAPDTGALQQRFLPRTGYTNRDFSAVAATITKSFGDIDLTSVTGYSVAKLFDSYDVTEPTGPFTSTAFPQEPVGYTDNIDKTKTRKFTQELRVTVPIGEKFDWLLGGFYTKEKTGWVQDWWATDVDNNRIGNFVNFNFGSTFREAAAFTNLTYRFTDTFDIQAGARQSFIKTTFFETDTGPFVSLFETADPITFAPGPNVLVFPNSVLTERAFTYAVSPRLKLNRDLMIYARFSSGYRPGGVNSSASLDGSNPTYQHDSTKNYEVGVKATILDGRLFLDGSLYRIDWSQVQVQVNNAAGLSFFSNGGSARSQGVELSLQAKLAKGLSLSGWVAYNEAKLVEDFPSNGLVSGNKGDRLPFSSKFSTSINADYSFPIGATTGSVGIAYSYVGKRLGNFLAAGTARQIFRSYDKLDLNAGIEFSGIKLAAFVNNVTNERGIIGGGVGTLISQSAFNLIQPRTYGLSLSKEF